MTPDLELQWQPVRGKKQSPTPTSTNTKNCTTIICYDADNVPTKIAAEKLQTKSKSFPFLSF